MIKKILYFLRHGESVYNSTGILQGQLDSPLTKKGRDDTGKIIHKLEGIDMRNIAHSPLLRAKQTAEIINENLNLPISEWKDIEEMDFGNWQSEMKYEHWDQFAHDFYEHGEPPPGGESKNDIVKRSEYCVKEICNALHESPILIVCHGMLMRILIGKWFTNWTEKELRAIEMPNLALYKVEIEHDHEKLNPLKYEFVDLIS